MKELYKLTNQEIQEKKNGIKKANIFLTKEQYKTLNELKQKYSLSFGTIARIILFNYNVLKPLRDNVVNNQLYKTAWRKTSIKINKLGYEDLDNAKSVNNALIMYCDKIDKKILNNEKLYMKLHNEIANMMQTTEDPFYDYNIFVRKYAYARRQMEKI